MPVLWPPCNEVEAFILSQRASHIQYHGAGSAPWAGWAIRGAVAGRHWVNSEVLRGSLSRLEGASGREGG